MDDSIETLDVEDLIGLYFAAEAPDERDAVFAEIAARNTAQSRAFFAAVMDNDEDPYCRAMAAAELWAHGDDAAQAYLLHLLRHENDDLLQEQALDGLLQRQPESLYGPLLEMWQDLARPLTSRRLAMLGLERADAEAACGQFCAFVRGWAPGTSLELVATALNALVRCGAPACAMAVAELRQRLGPEEVFLRGLCDETLLLLALELEPEPDSAAPSAV